ADQVPRRRGFVRGPRPRDPGPRRARPHRRHRALLLLYPRARGPDLRRRRRGPQARRRPPDPRPSPPAQPMNGAIMIATDAPRPVRPGEALDMERLGPYLRAALDAPDADIRVAQFPGGHSNLTYLVTVGELAYVLRRPPFGTQVKSAHDME